LREASVLSEVSLAREGSLVCEVPFVVKWSFEDDVR
jgi:hypothetical protein